MDTTTALLLAALSLLVRLLTPNRLVRRKLRLPIVLALLFPVVVLGLVLLGVSLAYTRFRDQLQRYL